MTVSVVIPTRNRPESLLRTLGCLSTQRFPIHEVVVVDASDNQMDQSSFEGYGFFVRTLVSHPSVCVQRNLGVKHAGSEWILLCDDDVEMPPDYVMKLVSFAERNPEANVATGLFLERGPDNQWASGHVLTFGGLLWNFIFQLPVWTDLNLSEYTEGPKLLLSPIRQFYLKRQNTFTLAGWPLVVDMRPPAFRTSVYSLGAALIRKQCLLDSPFDESLDPHGIGDHYGVALNLAQERPIHVLTDAFVRHHKSPVNRLEYPAVYRNRALALHYFMQRSSLFTSINTLFLLWSLKGNFIRQVVRGEFALAMTSAGLIWAIVSRSNPLLSATKS